MKKDLPPEETWDCPTDDPEQMCETCRKIHDVKYPESNGDKKLPQ